MATRSRTSFQKRQKEIARMEKQRDKAARRAQRKLGIPDPSDSDAETLEQPEDSIDASSQPADDSADSAETPVQPAGNREPAGNGQPAETVQPAGTAHPAE